MKCPTEGPGGAEILLAYTSNRLAAGVQHEIEEHMQVCSACLTRFREHRALWQILDQWQPDPVSKDFDDRLFERIAKADQSAWALKALRSAPGQRIRRAAPVLAAGLFVLGLLRFMAPF